MYKYFLKVTRLEIITNNLIFKEQVAKEKKSGSPQIWITETSIFLDNCGLNN